MASRIPYKNPTDYPWILQIIFYFQKKKFGQILNPSLLWGYSFWQSLTFLAYYLAINRKNSPISEELRSLVMVRVAQIHGCQFCIDINSMLYLERSKNQDRIWSLDKWKDSPLFSREEKWALEYAEAMTQTQSAVTDEHLKQLKSFLTDSQIVELTGVIAYQNLSARFNSALNVAPQGLCQLPKA
ncbi:MAG: carboxymuconolactone decarboxylase family protein [Proteobacteria bacterium]|nr:carboxymuconolactone decarboxylase family protein [Pseudomonadota bacterium]